ncbi:MULTISPECIES: exodeoxyribonuclease VII small subunit [Leptospira]|uniref:Exodeoxyribonuclease 7 small subunit n=4 Tax=Leptospira kirschneri TaxID=29507 RepID=A0A1T1DP10_9LEPT|nr:MULTISPECIES: exodeoxyribonuclease VII small subunit [Leptospira]EMO74107.1 exodeoxyribonuclease VII, small subunit [Leptospira kirschneri str. 200801925]EJO70576.1 exodeoxyribonuclease VII, small subunit [Leptospira kirschneri serovar Grippotyphosa str. RM52]EKO14986.1 exodeoxyribonuclease VII, small subunit [Leptospira kirschneri str. H1]EKO52763.1 exodeoxyribonuclease VII, small subunit [Leptospira kirschneri str. 200802841]EKO58709.1 exodeoxyribonuclease VII, small subunit [Leptospira k
MAETKSKISFEDALMELEQIAEKLERQDFSLEESLKAYERGMELKKICQGILDTAEGKIEALTKDESKKTNKTGFRGESKTTETKNNTTQEEDLF